MCRLASFPAIKTLDGFDFNATTGVPRAQVQKWVSLTFIERSENVVLLGPSGTAKTNIAIVLDYAATQAGIKARFTTATYLMLTTAHRQNQLTDAHKHFINPYRLLIIDKIGYLPMDRQQANLFFQVIANRYEKVA